jgi:hypothetical protein
MPSRKSNDDSGQIVLSTRIMDGYNREIVSKDNSPPSGFFHRQWHEAWKTVRTAPIPFVVCTLIASAVTCTACYWFVDHLYAATLLTVREERDKANRDNEKLSKQVEALRIYRANDNIPLKKRALILAQQIRDFTKNWKDDDPPEVQERNARNY